MCVCVWGGGGGGNCRGMFLCVCVPLLPIIGLEKVRQLSQVAFMRCVTVSVTVAVSSWLAVFVFYGPMTQLYNSSVISPLYLI